MIELVVLPATDEVAASQAHFGDCNWLTALAPNAALSYKAVVHCRMVSRPAL
jgi:hypothetical protein